MRKYCEMRVARSGTVCISDAKFFEIDTGLWLCIYIIHAEKDNLSRRFIFRPGLLHFSSFLFAGLAPGSPKIDNDYLAAQILQAGFRSYHPGS